MLFCWLFTLLVIAAFTDMVAGTFVAKGVTDQTEATSLANASAASVSMLFIVVAIIMGLILKKVKTMNEVVKGILAVGFIIVMFIIRMIVPINVR